MVQLVKRKGDDEVDTLFNDLTSHNLKRFEHPYA